MDLPSGELAAAIGDVWKRQRREIVASFGGISMLPTIAPGESLRIVCDGEASEGDVILFQSRGEVMVHRLLRRSRSARWMLTRGDANALPDRASLADALIGRITGIQRNDTWLPVPAWMESEAQRPMTRVVSFCFAIHPRVASAVAGTLWQFRRASEARGRLGMGGFLARLWTRTGGVVVDVDVLFTVVLQTDVEFRAVGGFEYGRAQPDSLQFAAASRLLGGDPKRRAGQDAFIISRGAEVVACSFSDPPSGSIGHQRGFAVDSRYRGHGLGPSILQYQARELRGGGVTAIEYHVALTNRASRRVFDRLGARPSERWIVVTLFRRFRFARSRSLGPSI